MPATIEAPVLIFVSPNGNDQNPGTQALPLRTFEEAVRRLQPLWGKLQRIKLAPGTYILPASPSITSIFLGQAAGVNGEPLVVEGAFADQIGSRQIQGAAQGSLTFTGTAVVADTLIGSRLRFTSGPAMGQAHVVTGNGANTLTVKASFSPVPVDGDSFVIERPAVEIVYPTGMSFYGGGASLLVLMGLRFRPQNAAERLRSGLKRRAGELPFFQLSGGLQAYAEGCEWNMDGGIFQVVEQATLRAGDVAGLITQGLLSSLDSEVTDLGCYAHNGLPASPQVNGAAGFRASNGFISGPWMLRKIGVNAQGGGLTFFSTSAKECSFTCDGFYRASYIEVYGPGRIENAPGDAAFKVSHGGRLRLFQIEVLKAKGSAIIADEGSLVLLEEGVTGTGNVQYGVWANNGAQIRADAKTNVTGTKGNLRLGIPETPRSWTEAEDPKGISDPITFTRIKKIPQS